MDELFAKYEHELVILRSLCREYAQRYPKVAAKLQIGGDTCDDPHIERLIQAVALLCARVSKRLDDSYPQFTEALLNLLFPHYLRPFPSCAIVRFCDGSGSFPAIARATQLQSAPIGGVPCTFSTAYTLAPAPVALASASYAPLIDAPAATRLPPDATSCLTLVFVAVTPGAPLCLASAPSMRFYIDADPSFCALLRDTLFMRCAGAYIESGEDSAWQRLPTGPVKPVGWADDEALLPMDARSHPASRLLAEYFAFPEKFNFFEVDLAALLNQVPAGTSRLTLHLAIAGLRADGDQARMLSNLSRTHLLQGCTPVVNLFHQAGVPITFDQLSADYPVLAHGNYPAAFEVYSVDQVQMVQQCGKHATVSAFRPFYSLCHGEDDGAGQGRYWLMRHDETLAICSPGHEKSIALVDASANPLAIERGTVSIELRCTNRDLPCAIRVGAAQGDLFLPGSAAGGTIRMLRRPTRPARLLNGPDTHWRLISHLASARYTKPIYVFIVTSTPESDGMDLATYDIAKQLGRSDTMAVEHAEQLALARRGKTRMPITAAELEKRGVKALMASMWSGAPQPRSADDYEETYIHAKVAIVDDAAFTVGSANLNVRSMALDSELNLLSQAMDVALDLRRKLFKQCTNDEGPAQFGDMKSTFNNWLKLMKKNTIAMPYGWPLKGQIANFNVDRQPGAPVI